MKLTYKREYLILFLKGVCMGSADIIPGVSGGTMALILGIYEDLIKAIRSFDSRFIRSIFSFKIRDAFEHVPLGILLPVLSGIAIAILTLSRIISFLLFKYPYIVWSFFFGLIMASAFSITKRVSPISADAVSVLLAGTIIGYVLVGFMPVSSPDSLYFIFFCGALSICAMILPGISGAFILVILGKYHYMLNAINYGRVDIVFVFLMGAATGIVLFSRILNFMLQRYRRHTIFLLSGLMLGSLRKIWPWKVVTNGLYVNVLPSKFNGELLFCLLMLSLGISIVFAVDHLNERGRDRA